MASAPPAPAAQRRIVVLCYPGGNLVDLAGPVQVFATANRTLAQAGGKPPYEVLTASEHGGLVPTNAGLPVYTRSLKEAGAGAIDTIIIAGGSPDQHVIEAPALVSWIKARAPRARRVCSVCSGTFVLAATGLLDGLRATTHWQWAERLQAMYPNLRVDPDPIYIREGAVWTSAGVTAGMDLALALVEQDFGHRTAITVARDMVMFIKRPGSQSQFSVPLLAQTVAPARFAELHAWIAGHLAGDLRVERLAEEAGMAPRSFARAYTAEVGRTPAKTVEMMRFEAACRALEETTLPLKRIAANVGYGEEQNLRRVFLRRLRIGPAQYRARFSAQPTAPAPPSDAAASKPGRARAAAGENTGRKRVAKRAQATRARKTAARA
jgi:transcriptional regulator GlxA family with amidase domain